jgi:cyclophilin family peptidyl-prolyl cis-trans isomerase
VGTAKRERQKANRQARLEELAKQARKEKTKKRGLTIGVVVVGGVLLLFGLAWLVGGDDDETATTIDPAATTIDPTATTVASASTAPLDTADLPASTDATGTTDVAASTTAAPTTTVSFEFGEGACPEADGSSELPDAFDGPPALCIDPSKTYTAEVTTNKGAFTIELNTEGAPGNVNNFVTLARFGYYDGTGCHRIIADFVVQCGRPGEDESAPGYTVADELPAEGEYAAGVVAMANTGAPNTGGGQWFIITGESGASLPAQYTILGTVTKGLDTTVQALENLADPTAENGVPPLVPVDITSVTITES